MANGKDKNWYFKHTFDMRNLPEVIKLNHLLGHKHLGFGVLMALFEVMGHNGGFLKFGDEYLYADMLGMNESELKCVTDTLAEHGCAEYRQDGFYHFWFWEQYQSCKKLSDINANNATKRWDKKKEPEPKAKKTKPAGGAESKPKEQAPPPVVSPEVKELFEYIDTILANYPNAKYAKRELAADDAQKVIDKYGMRDAKDLCNISYSWKAGRVEKPKSSDYGRLFRKGWVHEELEKERQKNEGNTNGKPSYNQSAQSNTYQPAGMMSENPPYTKYLPDNFEDLDYDGQSRARNEAYLKWKQNDLKKVANGRS